MRMLSQTHSKQWLSSRFNIEQLRHLAHQAYLSTFHYSQKAQGGILERRTVGGRRTLNRRATQKGKRLGGGIW
jgi:hypothetical protein